MFQSGFYELEVTPHLGSHMPGYYHRRLSTTILDRLYTRAWVVDDGKKTMALASVDCHGLNRMCIELIKHRVRALCGIPPENILVACSHTHTGGATQERIFGIDVDSGYLDFLTKRIADCIALAWQDRRSSKLRLGTGRLDGYSFCRIYRMKDGSIRTNPRIKEDIVAPYTNIDKTVLAAEITRDGRVDGILVSFACHCDAVPNKHGYSADYPGSMVKKLKEHYGQHVTVLFLQGPSGNINHIDPLHREITGTPRRYIEFGEALAQEVCSILEGAQESESQNLDSILCDETIPMRMPDEAMLAWAAKTKEEVKPNSDLLPVFDGDQIDLFFANAAISNHFHDLKELTTSLQVMKIGDLAIFTSPGELFSEYGDEIVKSSPFRHTVVSTFTNDYIGYIVSPECMTDGVYEYRLTDGMTLGETAGTQMNSKSIAMGLELKNRT